MWKRPAGACVKSVEHGLRPRSVGSRRRSQLKDRAAAAVIRAVQAAAAAGGGSVEIPGQVEHYSTLRALAVAATLKAVQQTLGPGRRHSKWAPSI